MNAAVMIAVIGMSSTLAGCSDCKPASVAATHRQPIVGNDDGDHDDDREETDDDRDNFWRVRISIVGSGAVSTSRAIFDCGSDGKTQHGACGPTLVTFKERQPPLLRATAASGWRFDHWESIIIAPDGTSRPRPGPMPDGSVYLNGFGYADTGEREEVTAVFVRSINGDAREP